MSIFRYQREQLTIASRMVETHFNRFDRSPGSVAGALHDVLNSILNEMHLMNNRIEEIRCTEHDDCERDVELAMQCAINKVRKQHEEEKLSGG